MGIFQFAKKGASSSRALILNIGSSTVMGSFVTYDSSVPKIESFVKTEISILADLSYEKFEREMQKALSTTLSKISALRLGSPDKIFVYLASPWYASQVRSAKLNRDVPFLVTKQMLDDMISKELKAFEEEEIKDKKMTSDEIGVIESKTVSVKLNGYNNDNPIGKTVRQLELSLFLAVAPVSLQVKIKESISKVFLHNDITFCTFLTASFLISREVAENKESYILLDIGGELTDVSIMNNGSPVQTISFPLGKNFLLRRLSKALNRSLHESATLCMLYLEGKMEDSIKDTCTRILEQSKTEWLNTFQKTLLALTSELSIPNMILLTVEQEVAPWFTELTSKEEFHQYGLTEKEFKVLQLNAELFHDKLSFGPNVERNPFIMIETLASSKFL